MYQRWSDVVPVEMFPGLTRRTLCAGERVMMVEFRLTTGTVVAMHSHPHEQAGYVVSGRVEFDIGGMVQVLTPGDSYAAPARAPHSARCLADAVLAEVFSPPRDDYRTLQN